MFECMPFGIVSMVINTCFSELFPFIKTFVLKLLSDILSNVRLSVPWFIYLS